MSPSPNIGGTCPPCPTWIDAPDGWSAWCLLWQPVVVSCFCYVTDPQNSILCTLTHRKQQKSLKDDRPITHHHTDYCCPCGVDEYRAPAVQRYVFVWQNKFYFSSSKIPVRQGSTSYFEDGVSRRDRTSLSVYGWSVQAVWTRLSADNDRLLLAGRVTASEHIIVVGLIDAATWWQWRVPTLDNRRSCTTSKNRRRPIVASLDSACLRYLFSELVHCRGWTFITISWEKGTPLVPLNIISSESITFLL